MPTEATSLLPLLGEQRAAIVERLREHPGQSVGELAAHLGISEVATRRHVSLLEDDGYLVSETVKQERGRPVARYRLSEGARRLYPQRYASVAGDLIQFLTDEHGREGLRAFLRWRLEREASSYTEAIDAEDLEGRLEQLADALSAAGYAASVTEDGDGFVLEQSNCAIYDVARDHPEMCAYEAATFSQVLGREVVLSRRQTIAAGSHACVCSVTPRRGDRGPEHADTTTAQNHHQHDDPPREETP